MSTNFHLIKLQIFFVNLVKKMSSAWVLTNVVFGRIAEVRYSPFSGGITPARWFILVDGFIHIIIFWNLWTDVLKGRWSRLHIFLYVLLIILQLVVTNDQRCSFYKDCQVLDLKQWGRNLLCSFFKVAILKLLSVEDYLSAVWYISVRRSWLLIMHETRI